MAAIGYNYGYSGPLSTPNPSGTGSAIPGAGGSSGQPGPADPAPAPPEPIKSEGAAPKPETNK